MITKTTMNMCGTLGPYGRAVTSRAVLAAGQPPGEERVVDVAGDQGDAQRRQHRAQDVGDGDLHDGDEQAGQRQHVDQDVEAQAEECVGLAAGPERQLDGALGVADRNPVNLFMASPGGSGVSGISAGLAQWRDRCGDGAGVSGRATGDGCGGRLVVGWPGAISVPESVTQPKIPPCAAIISRPTRWNSGKYEPTQSETTRASYPRSFASRTVVCTQTSVVTPVTTGG